MSSNVWTNIFIHPRSQLRLLIATGPQWMIIPLSLINGVLSSFGYLLLLWIGYPTRADFREPLFSVILLIAGMLLGLIHLYFGAFLYHLTGRWLGGTGTFTSLKCAVGWSSYPFIIVSLFNLLNLTLPFNRFLSPLLALIYLALIIYATILFFKLIAEAHSFSAWRALLAFLIAFLLVFVAFMILLMIIPLFLAI